MSSDVLYRSDRTSVSRVHLPGGDGGTAIRKEAHGGSAAARLRQEATALQRLAGVPGVPQLLEIGPGASWLLVTDTRGVPLAGARLGRDADPAWVVGFARSLAEVVAGIHRRGVIHKDINPANVLLPEGGSAAILVDFDLATTFAEERPEFTHHAEVAGTLPYLAPEQTGRTGWPVDHRADLYSLGATLYELLTGEPPFGSDVGEPLRLIHAHLARAPAPPETVNPATPAVLSAIVLRLLEKEPDQRYQSADGVAHDLARLEGILREPAPAASASGGLAGDVVRFGLGQRDFPLRLSAPSRLVGRDAERAALVEAYQQARQGGARGLLVSGAPGVGKSALLDELRLLVTEHGGWLVTGKFDQYRQDYAADAVPQAFRALGRLLLAEPDDRLARHRQRLLERLGPNAPLAAIWPEFATLLGIRHQPPEGDPEEVKSRIYRSCVDLLDAVGTPDRPVVMVLDDLQWAGSFPIGAIDALLTDEGLSGVMLVAAFREAEVDAAHPLAVMLERWQRLGVAPPQLRLQNLPPNGLAMLLGEMLRLEPREAARLAEAVGARTAGNPFDTVELVNALRREGALVPDQTSGWSWDPVTIRRFVGTSDVLDLLKARIDHLPPETGRLLEIAACLGGEAQLGLLAVAAGLGEDDVRDRLAPALEDGLLVPTTGDSASGVLTGARFRHDRVLEAAHEHLSPEARTHLHLSLARRLVDSAQWADLAAEQYLHAVAGNAPTDKPPTDDSPITAVTDPAEARRAAALFLAAGTRLKLINAPVAERYLSAATRLLDAVGTAPRDPLLRDVRRQLHVVLYNLGRFDDADRVYAVIAENCEDPVDLIPSGRLHISSLVGRGQMNNGLAVAMGLLADLGVDVPPAEELGPEIGRGLGELSAWVEQDDLAEDLNRPQISDPRWIAVAEVIDRAMAPAYFCDPAVLAWLVLHARRIWAEHGPCAHLVGPLAHAGILTVAVAGDYRTGYQAVRRIIAVGDARHYEPMTSQARFLLTVGSVAWFESLEDAAAEALRAREGGLRHGDTYHASFSYVTGLPFLFDSLPTLDQFLADLETGSALATRTGNTSVVRSMAILRQLARAMRGETHVPGGFTDDEFDDAEYLAATAEVPVAQAHYYAERTLAALVFADQTQLARCSAMAVELAPRTAGAYTDLSANLGHAMAAAWRLRDGAVDGDEGGDDEREQLLAAIDTSREWLAARAADVPVNFGHLVRLLDAERAWAVGDLWTAAAAFDRALSEVERRARPWQHALIVERMALFHLERGLQVTGNRLLAEASHRYAAWGAAGKVRALEADHPFLRDRPGATAAAGATPGTQRPGTVRSGGRSSRGHTTHTSSESIDLVGVLRAAQALSSETNLDRLRGRVVEVLTMMTGATGVQLALWKDDAGDWFVPGAGDQPDRPEAADATGVGPGGADGAGRLVTVDEAGARGLLPVTAFRYAERTGEPVRVDDATRDDRFARDPYFEQLEGCSLLVVPIQSNGRSRAMLLLENRLSRGAFSADRLDAVMLIAGQLAVCLDNALAERFRSLVQRSSELTLVCDRSGTVSYASSAAAELLGVEGVSLVGSSVGEAVAEEDRHGLLEWVALSGAEPGESNGALTCRLKPRPGDGWGDGSTGGPGEERWAEVTLTDLSADAAVGGLMLRLRDVTERRRLERALEELATTDPLTGVANRRRFDETLRAESERCLRAGNPLTLMLLDIDHFKSVNDTYGHPVGDAVLKAVAAQCRAAVRDIDLVARVGGEEFAVLLIDVGLHEGRQVADRMRKVIEATQVDLPGLAPLACTVSLGVAEFAGDSQDLMARADAALYRAKAEGRNRVCSSG